MDRCARSACKSEFYGQKYRIYNEPSTVEGYREYCVTCGRMIMEFPPNQVMKFEIIPVSKQD